MAFKKAAKFFKMFSREPKSLDDLLKRDFDRINSLSIREHKPVDFESAIAPENISKNRYSDVLALEKTRVRLSVQEAVTFTHTIGRSTLSSHSEDDSFDDTFDDDDSFNQSSDYINANLLTKGSPESAYIACQAPLPNTISDFWKMIWEQRVGVIIMLTQFLEKGRIKAHCYWPETSEIPCQYGYIKVSLCQQQLPYHGTTLRLFLLQDLITGSSRYVYHLQFNEWPDFGVPQSTLGIRTLLSMKELARSRTSQQSCQDSPVVVHCSAGLGRAGTFVAADWLRQSVLGNPKPNEAQFVGPARKRLFAVVSLLRSQRPGMVQTLEQYAFVLRVLYDTISSLQPWIQTPPQ